MKLYTEETLRNAINQVTDFKLTELSLNNYINSLTQIELPSDEEIDKQSDELGDEYYASEKIMWERGAKWVIDKIKNQQ